MRTVCERKLHRIYDHLRSVSYTHLIDAPLFQQLPGHGRTAADPDVSLPLRFQLARQGGQFSIPEADTLLVLFLPVGYHIAGTALIGPAVRGKLRDDLTIGGPTHNDGAVSYTHLDVYKRQHL